ncbi:related to ferroportin 1 [Phialocephala subalpina]|uniref:Solute carrier family 40 member n=1 Tax=Phialocephala subalpina TaxID=576137 RepID=A0A1L7X7B1_9HELO|nr:related to ferroportin 1 [Phialocephala subalpina]
MPANHLDDDAGLGSPSSPENEDVPGQMAPFMPNEEPVCITKSQAYNLYTSHFLSTWNIRTYEFAAIIFTQAAYPNTLRPAAIRGIARTLASICLTSIVGRWVDQNSDRLKTLISTISVNRVAVIGASVLWFFIVEPSTPGAINSSYGSDFAGLPFSELLKAGIFTLILTLGVLEILSGQGNMLSMERDWVVTVAAPAGRPYDLTHLNAVTKRIDLICKLIAPILISIVISSTNNKIGVLIVGGMSICSWFLEIFCARTVWNKNPKLQAVKPSSRQARQESEELPGLLNRIGQGLHRYSQDFRNYFSSRVWIPSLSLAILYFSALAYSSNFITFMINAGISLEIITIARAFGSVVEISSTLVTPVGIHVLGNAVNHGRFQGRDRADLRAALLQHETESHESGANEEDKWKAETGCERFGLWGLTWQFVNLIPVVVALWHMSPNPTSPPDSTSTIQSLFTNPIPSLPLLTLVMFTFLSLSRLGLWIYDLTTQQLTQTLVPPTQRSSFTGIEYSFYNLFELLQNVAAMVFDKSEEFKWLGIMSLAAVGSSVVMYAGWVWWVRGHLVHWERVAGCGKGCAGERKRGQGHGGGGAGWERVEVGEAVES